MAQKVVFVFRTEALPHPVRARRAHAAVVDDVVVHGQIRGEIITSHALATAVVDPVVVPGLVAPWLAAVAAWCHAVVCVYTRAVLAHQSSVDCGGSTRSWSEELVRQSLCVCVCV
jgi:hypothetical protein